MEQDFCNALKTHLLNAERLYNEEMEYIETIDEAQEAMSYIERTRDTKVEEGHDVTDLSEFLDECKVHFNEMVDKCLEEPEFRFNFRGWAREIRTDFRVEDFSGFSEGSMPESEEGVGGEGPARDGGVQTVKTFVTLLQNNGRVTGRNAEIREQRSFFWVSSVAWSFAVIGMVIALAFLTNDFYEAQTNLALSIDRIKTDDMPYPAITICADAPGAPLFLDFPTKEYPGEALFRLARLVWRNTTAGRVERIEFPNTIPSVSNGFEELKSGPSNDSCDGMKQQTSISTGQNAMFGLGDMFNVTKIKQDKREGKGASCYWCVRMGSKNKIHAQPGHFRGSGMVAPSFEITVHRSKMIEGCNTMAGIRDTPTRKLMYSHLRKHATELAERGTLDFGDFPPGNAQFDALQVVHQGFRFRRFGGGDYVASMGFACNVYLYSGFFYPTAGDPAPDIRYRFDFPTKAWLAVGTGPYFTTRTWDPEALDIVGPGHAGVERDRYTTNHMQILFQDPEANNSATFVPLRTKIANIEANTGIFLAVERKEERGKITYGVDSQTLGPISSELTSVSEFSIGIGYQTPFTHSVNSVSTMQWSSYMTDVFEFIGLFTGVCVFTLFVAPAHTLVKG